MKSLYQGMIFTRVIICQDLFDLFYSYKMNFIDIHQILFF
ncbi:hypothetical protein J504_3148 [Acinetobacter baumannii 348935]|nr:hypothetical protein J504_3148 [Acinetobacter baumannii 348935]